MIEVGDEGPGLPAVLAKYLVAEADETTPEGNGLGLWIVRRSLPTRVARFVST